jgi:RimJ/RimL family protein N-acetyltransferase
MGCLDTRRQQRRWLRVILPSTLGRLLTGRYHLGRRTLRYAARLVVSNLRGETPVCDLNVYPAHLHINLPEAYRGLGLGRELMQAYLERLRGLGTPGVHLHTTSVNIAACRLYESLGFALLDRRPTGAWRGLVDQPVENRCYGLELAKKEPPAIVGHE